MARLLRLDGALDRTGQKRSCFYDDIARGLMVRPVKIGPRAAAWPEQEIEKIISARIAGADQFAIRKLVEKLHAARQMFAQLAA